MGFQQQKVNLFYICIQYLLFSFQNASLRCRKIHHLKVFFPLKTSIISELIHIKLNSPVHVHVQSQTVIPLNPCMQAQRYRQFESCTCLIYAGYERNFNLIYGYFVLKIFY